MKPHGIGESYQRWAERGKFELSRPFQRAFATDNRNGKCGGAGGDGEAVMEKETGQQRARAGACSLFREACDTLLMEKKLRFLFCGNSFVPH